MRALGWIWILIISVSLPLWAQQQPPPAPVEGSAGGTAGRSSGGGQRIWLDVIVTDKAGHPVPGLRKQDFTVLDNNQPQDILNFLGLQEDSAENKPATQLIIVIDAVNTGFQGVSYEQQQLVKLLKKNEGKLALPTSLVMFTDSGVQMQNAPTQDGNVLTTMLDGIAHSLRVISRSQGFYGAADRLQLSLAALGQIIAAEKRQPGKKLLIWTGPAWPILSGPGIELTNNQQQGIFSSVAFTTNALRQARIKLYNAMPLGMEEGLNRLLYYQAFLKPISKADQVQEGNLALQVLALQSGGRVLNAGSDLAAQIASCITDADAFYTLSFNAQAPDTKDEFHKLEIKVDKPGIKIRTNTGYYLQP